MNPLPSVVYLFGDERYLIDSALRELEAQALAGGDPALNREVFEAPGATPAQVVNAAKTLPFLGARRFICVRDADRWKAEDWLPFLSYLENPNPTTCLVFVAESLDRRTKAGKLLQKTAQLRECRRPKENELYPWAQRLARDAGLDVGPKVLQALVLRVGPDLATLAQEVEKLRVFAGAEGRVDEADVEALVGESRGTTVFRFCDALGERNLPAALRNLRRLLQLGEPPVRLLYMVVRQFRSLWQALEMQEGGGRVDRKRAAAVLGVPPFAVDSLLRQASRWDLGEVRRGYQFLVRADLSLKSGGGTEVLQELVLRFCRRDKQARPGLGRGARSDSRGNSRPAARPPGR